MTTIPANPSRDEGTPRPWTTDETDDGFWEITYHGDGTERALYEHPAHVTNETDARLIVEAVNAYDRLVGALESIAALDPDAYPEDELAGDAYEAVSGAIEAARTALRGDKP